MYSVLQYGHMIADRVRMEAYVEALRRAVRPGDRVLDVGCGTGIFALLACRFGAGRVIAVEPAPAIETARELARANGVADRIEFVCAPLEELDPAVRADVIVADLRGALPYAGRHLPTMRLARERFLAPGGRLLPLRDEIRAVPLEAPELYAHQVTRWAENPWGLDMGPAREMVVNSLWTGVPAKGRTLAEPAHLATVDYAAGPEPDLRTRVELEVTRDGTVHALLLWFDALVAEGLGFSNAPEEEDTVYGRMALPLREPLAVRAGERLGLTVSAVLRGDEYLWSWRTEHRGADGAVHARQRQSTFLGAPLSPEALRPGDLDARPALDQDARVDRFALCLADGRRTLEAIARATTERFPGRFRDAREAAGHVGALLRRYAKSSRPSAAAREAPEARRSVRARTGASSGQGPRTSRADARPGQARATEASSVPSRSARAPRPGAPASSSWV